MPLDATNDRPIPEGHRRLEDFGFASPSVEAPVTDDVLRRLQVARAMIANEDGWSPCGAYTWREGRREPSRCTVMAVADAGPQGDEVRGCLRYLRDALPHGGDGTLHGLITYNDKPTTTHADVLALFDRAINARRAENAQAAVQAGEAK